MIPLPSSPGAFPCHAQCCSTLSLHEERIRVRTEEGGTEGERGEGEGTFVRHRAWFQNGLNVASGLQIHCWLLFLGKEKLNIKKEKTITYRCYFWEIVKDNTMKQ